MAKTSKAEETEVKDISRVIASINRKAGRKVIGKMSTMTDLNVERISSGVEVLDTALGGGFPTRRVTEIYGIPSSGKSLISMLMVAQAQSDGKKCVLIDVEDAYDPVFAEKFGVNNDELIVANAFVGEEIINLINALLEAQPDVIIVDSIAAMVPNDEMIEEDSAKQHMTLKARLLSKAIPKINALNKKTAIIFINQIRSTLAMYGAPTTTPGGNAIGFYSSIRLEVKSNNSDKIYEGSKKGDPIGQIINFRVIKNKTFAPGKQGSFKFFYDTCEVVEPGGRRKKTKDD